LLLDTIDGAELFDVRFTLTDRETLRARLVVNTPLGQPQIPARIEISPRGLWLPTEAMVPVDLPAHAGYEFSMPAIPAPALEETLSEKLAAWRRRRKIRDVYDLFLFGRGGLNEALIRRLLVLKVWHDVVDDGLGTRPFDPAEIVADIDVRRLPPEDIGLLTQPVEPTVWLAHVRARYGFVTDLDDEDERIAAWARCRVTELVGVPPSQLGLDADRLKIPVHVAGVERGSELRREEESRTLHAHRLEVRRLRHSVLLQQCDDLVG
jgi:predicted nucleotidyltransferase component of viral defense system